MNSLKLILLTATFMLAMAFTFSCTNNSDENPFAIQYLYCVNPNEKTCVPGVVTECPKGAAPKDVCPAEFVEKAPSSSSGGRSSSGGGDNDPFAGLIWIEGWTYEFWKEYLKYYDPDRKYVEQRCQNGAVEWRCEHNDVWYSPLTHFCDDVWSNDELTGGLFGKIEFCGNQIYVDDPSYHRCRNGVVEIKCVGTWYSSETHSCTTSREYSDGVIALELERCGSSYYERDPDNRCNNGVVEWSCERDENETWYNPETHYCDRSTSTYTVKNRVRCGSDYIRYSGQRCNNEVIEEKCGDTWYNIITQGCYRDFDLDTYTLTYTLRNRVRCGS